MNIHKWHHQYLTWFFLAVFSKGANLCVLTTFQKQNQATLWKSAHGGQRRTHALLWGSANFHPPLVYRIHSWGPLPKLLPCGSLRIGSESTVESWWHPGICIFNNLLLSRQFQCYEPWEAVNSVIVTSNAYLQAILESMEACLEQDF